MCRFSTIWQQWLQDWGGFNSGFGSLELVYRKTNCMSFPGKLKNTHCHWATCDHNKEKRSLGCLMTAVSLFPNISPRWRRRPRTLPRPETRWAPRGWPDVSPWWWGQREPRPSAARRLKTTGAERSPAAGRLQQGHKEITPVNSETWRGDALTLLRWQRLVIQIFFMLNYTVTFIILFIIFNNPTWKLLFFTSCDDISASKGNFWFWQLQNVNFVLLPHHNEPPHFILITPP